MIELTLDRAKELLAEAVALKGEDYVYTTPDGKQPGDGPQIPCRYVHDAEPGCLVGHVLHAVGVSLDQLSQEETNPASTALRNLSNDEILKFEPGVSHLLQDVQMAQDTGTPWGQALREALAEQD